MNQRSIRITFSLLLIAIGIAGRLFIDIPNVETVTVVTLLGAALIGGYATFIIPLVVIAATDMVIGNDLILIYTWSAWLAVAGIGSILKKRNKSTFRFSLELTGLGLVSTLFFFAWTNFGVWHISGMYPHTALGLLASYTMGLPFLKSQLMGNLLIVPAVSVAVVGVWNAVQILVPRSVTKVEPASAKPTS